MKVGSAGLFYWLMSLVSGIKQGGLIWS